jgi:hypothetical protein
VVHERDARDREQRRSTGRRRRAVGRDRLAGEPDRVRRGEPELVGRIELGFDPRPSDML